MDIHKSSSSSSDIFSTPWLHPLINLIYDHQFAEAYALADYFPAAPGRKMLQIAALLGQYLAGYRKKSRDPIIMEEDLLKKCEDITKTLPFEIKENPGDFARTLNEMNPNLLGFSIKHALQNGHLYLGHFCLEALRTHGGKSYAEKIFNWLILAELAYQQGLFELCDKSFLRLYEIKTDSENLLQSFPNQPPHSRWQLLKALIERGMALSPENSFPLVAELLLKTEIALSKEDEQYLKSFSDDPYLNQESLIGNALAKQGILKIQRIEKKLGPINISLNHTLSGLLDPKIPSQEKIVADVRALKENLNRLLPTSSTSKDRGQKEIEVDLQIRHFVEALLPLLRTYFEISYNLEKSISILLELTHQKPAPTFGENIYPISRIEELLQQKTYRKYHKRQIEFKIETLIRLQKSFGEENVFQEKWRSQLYRRLHEYIIHAIELQSQLQRFVSEAESLEFEEILNKIEYYRQHINYLQYKCQDLLAPTSVWREYRRLQSTLLDLVVSEGSRDYSSIARSAPMAPPEFEKEPPHIIIERYTNIQFPNWCEVDKKVELKIQLTKAIPKLSRILKKLDIPTRGKFKEVLINVIVTAPGFAIQKNQRQLIVPVEGDSNEIVFDLYAAEAGDQVVEIEFFQESTRIGHVLVETRIQPWKFEDRSANILWIKDPSSFAGQNQFQSSPGKTNLLHVTWDEKKGQLIFKLPNLFSEKEWEKSTTHLKIQIEEYLQELNAFLTEAVSFGTPTNEVWESIYLNLQGIGESLMQTLLPDSLVAIISTWKENTSLVISTNEQWIPWELVFDGQDFWGRKFIVTRYPRPIDYRRWPDLSIEHVGRRPIKKIVNVIGGGIPAAEGRRASLLFNRLSPAALVEILKEKTVSDLNKSLSDADLVHFTCHGYLSPHLLQIADSTSRTINLLPDTVKRLPLPAGGMVFANTCSSAAPVLLFGKFNSFGWEFYLRGVNVFIGTLGAVPTKYAVDFAETVYKELLSIEGNKSIGQAIAKAKTEAESRRNIYWLLYCVYGDPDYVAVI